MLAKALADIVIDDVDDPTQRVFDFIGTPLVALLVAVLVAMVTLGRPAGMDRKAVTSTIEQSLPPIAGILLIVAAGGGFKQTLVDSGIAEVITDFAKDSSISVLLLGWTVAAIIRLATGSATVATVTAAGILVDVAADLGTGEVSLLVLAIGSGSLIFSHVNDAGFWLVKEYFGLTVGQNIKSWSVMETIISVFGLLLVLLLGVFV